jgi:hypothetical protein
MKTLIVLAVMVFSSAASAVEPTYVEVNCNWGKLTMTSIQAGFPQGPHVSDPSGDGTGPGDIDSPRVGLGNVVTRGNLQATCDFIESQI